MEEMRLKEERMERSMSDVAAENRRLLDPLNKAKEENIELKRQLASYEKDKVALKPLFS
ncbi:unnamed protein product [Protopolystoma xenopodis]|uniref:Dynein regulatory complex subunit 4 n=1 Tax=Protopolystoma xenopodis TaxID=117903 RepID=A0A448XL70_9PLAT|nr:unnamed protein product [Protopolystoma xenopodis]